MYIKPRKRSNPNPTSHPGPALDNQGYPNAPTSPHEDPYWTLRISKKQDESEIKDVLQSEGKQK